ncbi:MAG TPA: response regulator transcription factor [Bacteroidia bacterium]|nr:response regulator transcription factor [Bacteroidia bacterium]
MIVDDHQILIDGLKSLLAESQTVVVVAEANNGDKALELLAQKQVDVVLMDISMPLMNGWDTTQLITSDYPGTKVIALSSYSEKAIILKMINAGASGFMLKNIKKELLLKAIEAVHKGETFFSSEISTILLEPSQEETFSKPKPISQSLSLLSSREVEVLKLIAHGLSNTDIGEKLFISANTVKSHRENIMKKLELHNVVELVRYAIDNKLIQ